MAIHGSSVLVLLALCAAPTAAVRQGDFDGELGLEGQIGTQDDDQSTAAGQEGIHVQNSSLTQGPTTKQIKMASSSAGFAKKVYSAFVLGGQFASIPGVGGTIISKGIAIWVSQKQMAIKRKGLCSEFLHTDFGDRLMRAWENVVCPAMETGALPVAHAINWLLYMETFLAVLAYLSAHPDHCTRYLSAIQASWNDMADGVQLASAEHYWKYEFHWRDFKNHPVSAQRDKNLAGLKKQLKLLGTTWNPFQSTSSLDRIIRVAKKLRLYNDAGELTAPECLAATATGGGTLGVRDAIVNTIGVA
jgi:hypothetical protein